MATQRMLGQEASASLLPLVVVATCLAGFAGLLAGEALEQVQVIVAVARVAREPVAALGIAGFLSPGKTQNYGTPIHLEIVMGQALREVVLECIRSPVVCPYLIHYIPKARRRKQLDTKLHWNAVTPDYLTKVFS